MEIRFVLQNYVTSCDITIINLSEFIQPIDEIGKVQLCQLWLSE